MERIKSLRSYIFAVSLWVLIFILALKFGAVSDANFDLIFEVRLPRVILASVVGMGLAVAGAALQALFSNALCEPYTLGISSGSALGAVLGLSFGLQWMVAGLAGTAFIGALLFAAILYLISFRSSGGNTSLLLGGVMLGFLGSSLVALWVALSDPNGLQSAIAWLYGDLSRARLKGAVFLAVGVSLLILFIWAHWRELDALLMGEEGAGALGVDVTFIRRRMIILTSLLIGLCVSAAGMVGFVGLVVPHFSRRWVGSLHIRLIPLSAIWGGIALTTADWVSRVIARPYELPVGIVTALIGAPIFMGIMLKKRETL